MANSYKEYTASSVTVSTQFATPPYLDGRGASDIVVTVDSIVQPASAYTLTGTNITFTTGNTPTDGKTIRITRNSSQDQRLTDYSDASLLTADVLDADANQLFFISQEALDTASETNLAAGTFYYSQGTAPSSTVAGTLWYDTSSSPNVLKVYNGSEWEITSPVTTKKRYTTGGGAGSTALTDGGSLYSGKSYFVDTAFNSKAEVYLNGVKLLSASTVNDIPQYGDYFHSTTDNKVYVEDLTSSDVLEVVTHSGSFNTMIQTSEDAAAASATAAATSETNAAGSASAAAASAGSAAGSATTASNHASTANTHKVDAQTAKTAAETAQAAAEAARDSTAVTTVAGNLANGATSTINIVAGIDDQVSTVAGNTTNINTLADSAYKTDIETVGDSTYKTKVETVSDNITEVQNVSNNMSSVTAAAGNASTASTKATEAANSATAAASSATAAASSATQAANEVASTVKTTGTQTIAGAKTFTSKATFTNTNNNANIVLESSDDDASSGPNATFRRNSASPAAGDIAGVMSFSANRLDSNGDVVVDGNGNNDSINYAQFVTGITDATENNESGSIHIKMRKDGNFRPMITIDDDGAQTEFVINDGGDDIDFRVESDTNQHAIYLNANANKIGLFNSTPQQALDVTGNIQASGSVTAGDLTLNDATPLIKLQDTDGGEGRVYQVGYDLNHKSCGLGSDYGGYVWRGEDGNGNNKKRMEITGEGDFKVLKDNLGSGLHFDASTGRLGVDLATNPTHTLHVDGTAKFTGIAYFDSDIQTTGNINLTRANAPAVIANRSSSTGPIFRGQSDGTTEVEIGYNGNDPYIRNYEGGGLRISTDSVKPTISGYNVGDNQIDLGAASSRFKDIYLGGGVVFGTAAESLVDSNTLDDYEEGRWNPTFVCSTNNGPVDFAATYDSDTRGYYTKVGNMVTVHGRIVTSSAALNDSSGNIRIAGLPFPTASTGTQVGGNMMVGRAQKFDGNTPIGGQVLNNNTVLQLCKQTAIEADYTTFGSSLIQEHTPGSAVANDIAFTAVYWTNS